MTSLLWSCAQAGSLSGGEKDTDPPLVVYSYPENETVNFTGNFIEVEFNEYVKLNDINNQLVISPSLEQKPEISLTKRTLNIELKEELKSNTTYCINFGEGIKDNNEGNILRNFSLAFSTGPELDSLSVQGVVSFTEEAKPAENVKVMLYASSEDSLPLTTKPAYFAQSDETGKFAINYLPKGTFKVFALQEENGNFIYDDFQENIGFIPTDILLNETNSDSLSIMMFNEEKDLGFIDEVLTDSLGNHKIVFEKKQADVKAFLNGQELSIQHLSESRDTLYVYLDSSAEIVIERTDIRFSNFDVLKDTIEIEVFNPDEVSDFGKNLGIFNINKHGMDSSSALEFKTNKYITDHNPTIEFFINDSLCFTSDSIVLKDPFNFIVPFDLESESSYTGFILPNSFMSNGIGNQDSIKFSFKTLPDNHYGELLLKIETQLSNPLLLLKNSKNKIVDRYSLIESNEITISNLEPGTVTLFLLNDGNNDLTWTTGNYELGILPEEVYKFPQEIEIRSNWSQQYTWIVK